MVLKIFSSTEEKLSLVVPRTPDTMHWYQAIFGEGFKNLTFHLFDETFEVFLLPNFQYNFYMWRVRKVAP